MHVTSDEPGHFRLFVDGENIIDADYRLFYVHRGMEKLAETRMGYNEVTFLSDRVCGSAALLTAPPTPRRWKRVMGIQVPERAQMIRAIVEGGTPALASAQPRSCLPLYRLDSG